MEQNLMLAGVIVGGVILVLLIAVGLPVVLSFRHAAKARELEHVERMKALELGRPWPGIAHRDHASPENEGWFRSKEMKIGVAIPLGALGIAFVASSSHAPGSPVQPAIWIAASLVGVAGVICGTILIMREPAAPAATPPSRAAAKPPVEDDSLDTVSRRG